MHLLRDSIDTSGHCSTKEATLRLARSFGSKLTSDAFDATLGEWASFVTSILVFGLGFAKLASLPLTETQLFFGLLLVLIAGLLCGAVGLLIRIENNTRQRNAD